MLRSSCRRNEAASGGEAVVRPGTAVCQLNLVLRIYDGYAAGRSLRQLLRDSGVSKVLYPSGFARDAVFAQPMGNRRVGSLQAASQLVRGEEREQWEALRALRRKLAEEHGVPPYVIFPDSTLLEMLRSQPCPLRRPAPALLRPGVCHRPSGPRHHGPCPGFAATRV